MFCYRDSHVEFNLNTPVGRDAFLDYAIRTITEAVDKAGEKQWTGNPFPRKAALRKAFIGLADGIRAYIVPPAAKKEK